MIGNFVINIYNLISIIILFIMFFIVIKRYLELEKFNNVEGFGMNNIGGLVYDNPAKYIASNTRIQYENEGVLPWNRHVINSSIPYDVKVKKEAVNVYYYEFDNKTYNEKLKEIFKSNCEELIIAVDGNIWNDWVIPKTIKDDITIKILITKYNKIYKFVYDKINNSNIMNLPGEDVNQKIQIVHDIMIRYKTHSQYDENYMFDIDVILYRAGKFQGKHVKIIAIINGDDINILLLRIIGVVSEDKIVLHPYKGYDNMNVNYFNEHVPMVYGNIENDNNSSIENTFIMSDEYMNEEVEKIMYKSLLRENIPQDVDIDNNNLIPKPEEIVKRNRCFF